MIIHFHGAVRTVTGSLHILESARGDIVLLDCGMFQGRRSEARTRNSQLPMDPRRVKAIVLSHAHIDHTGNLPTWAAHGLRCPIHATAATVDLAALMLRDSAHIQMMDARHVNQNLRHGEQPVEPLYMPDDAEAAIRLLRGQVYKRWFDVVPGIRAMYYDAGHMLGSASVLIEETASGITKRLLFTGDVGRNKSAILRDPEPPPAGADVMISESTYGDRDHPPQEELSDKFGGIIQRTAARGGKVIIPAFAIGRTQTLMYALRELQRKNQLPEIPVYVDSPLASGASEIYKRHPECYDAEASGIFEGDGALFALDNFTATRSAEDSKKLNFSTEPAIIIAASGMCEAGRILHHLLHGLGSPKNTVLFVGFQAEHTLGRRLIDKNRIVRVFGREVVVEAEITVLNGFSGHAGQTEMRGFLESSRPNGPIFLVHGDEARSTIFEQHLEQHGFPDVRIPNVGETFRV